MKTITSIAIGAICAAGLLFTAGCSSPHGNEVSVPLAETSAAIDLHYDRLNPDKPFRHGVLLLFANGAYRIASDGEDHFGSYVLDAAKISSGMTFSAQFISWPSPDWGDNVALHSLVFHEDGRFEQILKQPGGGESQQAGHWSLRDNSEKISPNESWSGLKNG